MYWLIVYSFSNGLLKSLDMRASQIFGSSLLKSLAMAEESQQLLEDLSKYVYQCAFTALAFAYCFMTKSSMLGNKVNGHKRTANCRVLFSEEVNTFLVRALLVQKIDACIARRHKHMERMLAAGIPVWLGPHGDRLVGKFVPQHRVNQRSNLYRLVWQEKLEGKRTGLFIACSFLICVENCL